MSAPSGHGLTYIDKSLPSAVRLRASLAVDTFQGGVGNASGSTALLAFSTKETDFGMMVYSIRVRDFPDLPPSDGSEQSTPVTSGNAVTVDTPGT